MQALKTLPLRKCYYLIILQMISLFRNAFGGLSKQVWLLAFVMFINRSGTMVIAFLTVYLTQKLHFSIQQAGVIMTLFGAGSIFGTWMGGKLTDKIGYYQVQFWSLFLGGIMFIVMVHIQHFYMLGACAFCLSALGEAYRPANTASIADFSTPENFTRSVSLIRLAINVGWSIGPAVGGFLAAHDYALLFWADGFTNIGAGLMVWAFLRSTKKKKTAKETAIVVDKKDSALRDRLFMIFILLATFYAIAFSQLFTIGPLFYKQACNLSEIQIGYLLGLNGLIVALFEMVFIYKIEGKFRRMSLISFGAFLVVPNYIIFLITHNYAWLIVGILFATFSEMFAMPFMNAFSIEKAKPHNRGQYSALYAMSWSVAQISAPLIGTQTIALYGYDALWYILGSLGLIATIGFGALRNKLV